MSNELRSKLIANYVRKGGNASTGAALLDEIVRDGLAVAHGLHFHGFAGERLAECAAAEVA